MKTYKLSPEQLQALNNSTTKEDTMKHFNNSMSTFYAGHNPAHLEPRRKEMRIVIAKTQAGKYNLPEKEYDEFKPVQGDTPYVYNKRTNWHPTHNISAVHLTMKDYPKLTLRAPKYKDQYYAVQELLKSTDVKHLRQALERLENADMNNYLKTYYRMQFQARIKALFIGPMPSPQTMEVNKIYEVQQLAEEVVKTRFKFPVRNLPESKPKELTLRAKKETNIVQLIPTTDVSPVLDHYQYALPQGYVLRFNEKLYHDYTNNALSKMKPGFVKYHPDKAMEKAQLQALNGYATTAINKYYDGNHYLIQCNLEHEMVRTQYKAPLDGRDERNESYANYRADLSGRRTPVKRSQLMAVIERLLRHNNVHIILRSEDGTLTSFYNPEGLHTYSELSNMSKLLVATAYHNMIKTAYDTSPALPAIPAAHFNEFVRTHEGFEKSIKMKATLYNSYSSVQFYPGYHTEASALDAQTAKFLIANNMVRDKVNIDDQILDIDNKVEFLKHMSVKLMATPHFTTSIHNPYQDAAVQIYMQVETLLSEYDRIQDEKEKTISGELSFLESSTIDRKVTGLLGYESAQDNHTSHANIVTVGLSASQSAAAEWTEHPDYEPNLYYWNTINAFTMDDQDDYQIWKYEQQHAAALDRTAITMIRKFYIQDNGYKTYLDTFKFKLSLNKYVSPFPALQHNSLRGTDIVTPMLQYTGDNTILNMSMVK